MDSLSGLTKLVLDSSLGKKASSSDAKVKASPTTSSADLVSISPDGVLDYIKSQAASLKTSLPGIITNSVLQSTGNSDPLNALLNQFVNPIQSFLSSNTQFSQGQLKSLQEEVAGLKDYLPTLLSSSLLAPSQNTGSPLDGIVQSMSNQLTDLASQVQQKMQV